MDTWTVCVLAQPAATHPCCASTCKMRNVAHPHTVVCYPHTHAGTSLAHAHTVTTLHACLHVRVLRLPYHTHSDQSACLFICTLYCALPTHAHPAAHLALKIIIHSLLPRLPCTFSRALPARMLPCSSQGGPCMLAWLSLAARSTPKCSTEQVCVCVCMCVCV